MKTINGKKRRLGSFFLATAILAGSGFQMATANDDALLNDTETILNSDQIDIDGQFRSKQSDAQRLSKMRKKIEKKHERMIQKKIEDIRIQEELRLGQKLQQAFDGTVQGTDSVSMGQAGVAKTSAGTLAPMAQMGSATEKKNRVIPSFSLLSVSAEAADYESEISTSVAFETLIKDRFLVGVSLGYSTLKIKDVNPNYASTFNSFNNYNYNYNNFNTFGASSTIGRDMKYNQLDLNVNGKFYVLKDSKIKPYVGLGLGYRRSTLEYSESDPYYNQGIGLNIGTTLENAEYIGNYVTGQATVGADVAFNSNVGARLELGYTRGITESSNPQNVQDPNNLFYNSVDQTNLDNVGKGIEKGSIVGISAGLIIGF